MNENTLLMLTYENLKKMLTQTCQDETDAEKLIRENTKNGTIKTVNRWTLHAEKFKQYLDGQRDLFEIEDIKREIFT